MNTPLLSRRDLLQQASLTVAAAQISRLLPGTFAETAGVPAPSPVTVQTAAGTLRGEQANGIQIFRGIPFAEPPTGARRFQPPLPKRPWQGVLDVTRFGPEPFQPGTPVIPKSEDCLQLNLWTSQPLERRRGAPQLKPIFVWIHGGGFTGGHSFDPLCDGSQFAQEGIVCITVAYRLGVFGFLDMAPLLGEAYAGTANNALRDLILALQWVQANAKAFGGDPTRVTIGGESAGAKLCGILMGTPAAQHLFHSVISESGGAERLLPRAQSRTVAEGFGRTWTILTNQPVTALPTADPARIIDAQERFLQDWPQHFPLRPEVDGSLLPHLPIRTIAAGSTRGKRLLLGTNRDESALFLGPHPAKDAAAADLGNLTTAAFAPIYAQYAALYPNLTVEQRRICAVTAEEYWIPSLRLAAAHANKDPATGNETYVYRLDFAKTTGPLAGYAFHSLDLGLVWNKPGGKPADLPAEAALATQMHAAWAAFIHGNAPTAPGLPTWTQWNPTTRPTMLLNTTNRMENQPQQAELQLWNGLL